MVEGVRELGPEEPTPPRSLAFATSLTAFSGYVDAVGYAEVGRLYLSFMSGNSTQLGVAVMAGDWRTAGFILFLVANFVAGSAAGTFLLEGSSRFGVRLVLCAEAAILGVGFLLAGSGSAHLALVLAAMAMGMQNTLHQVIGGADIGRGFLSGNLLSLGQSLARIYRRPGAGLAAFQNGLSWLVFVAGVLVGVFTLGKVGLAAALGGGAAAVLLCLIVLTRTSGRSTDAP